jgi:hypothetical protein
VRHPEILDRLRARGLTVVETNGWRDRGSATFAPIGSLNHATAVNAGGFAPSLGAVINGRPDLDGPLAQVLQSRQTDAAGLDVVYLVAAGRANHADCSGFDPSMVAQHWEYARPAGRKSDFVRALLDPSWLRNRVSAIIQGTPTIPQEDDMLVLPSWAKPIDGRWPNFVLVDRSDTRAVITATPGAPFLGGLDKYASPKFTYGSAYGLSVLTITGLASLPRGIAEAPNGQVILACADGSTFQIAANPAG